jgi:gas vesicle protein
MFSRVRIAIRFFFVGLAVGVLLAPRSGEETRRLVREKADRLLNDILDAATLGTYESGAGSIEPDEEASAPRATRSRSRNGNGSSTRSRSTRSRSASASSESNEDAETGASTAGI